MGQRSLPAVRRWIARKYLARLKCGAEELFFHIVAVLHSPHYREEKAGAALGRQLAALLDPETPVPGVTSLKVRDDLKGLGEHAFLGRPLTSDEAQQFTHHVRRIAGILALHGELDAHYGASVE